jgi:hypothetical protein
MENPVQPTQSNTGRNIAIVVIGIIVLMCCCAVIAIAALTIMGPVVGNVFSSINNSLDTPRMPDGFPTISPDTTMPAISDFPTMSPDATFPSANDVIPQGGKGNDTERASAWSYVILQAALEGCTMSNPKASDFSIVVKQEPNSDGVWVEEWTVNCDGGTKKPYTVTFTPGVNGNTDIKVK